MMVDVAFVEMPSTSQAPDLLTDRTVRRNSRLSGKIRLGSVSGQPFCGAFFSVRGSVGRVGVSFC